MSRLLHALRLRRAVSVELWNVSGAIAFGAKRPVELALCELARAGDIDEAAVVRELKFRTSLARRLLVVCTGLGLLTREHEKYRLSAAGASALELGSVFVPEERRFWLAIVDDPLVPGQIVTVGRLEERDVMDRELTTLPAWFRSKEAAPVKPLMNAPVRVDDLAPKGVRVGAAELIVELVIDDVAADVVVSGKIGESVVDAHVEAPSLRFKDAWQQLVPGLAGWNDALEECRVEFGAINEDEIEALVRRVSFKAPALHGLGKFNDIEHVIPLAPRTAEDAAQWARERMFRRLHGHVLDDAALAGVFAEAAAPFASFALVPPRIDDVLTHARGNERAAPPAAWWWLQAGRDLVGGAT